MVERFHSLCVVFSLIRPLFCSFPCPSKLPQKGTIPPILRTIATGLHYTFEPSISLILTQIFFRKVKEIHNQCIWETIYEVFTQKQSMQEKHGNKKIFTKEGKE